MELQSILLIHIFLFLLNCILLDVINDKILTVINLIKHSNTVIGSIYIYMKIK